MNIVEENLKKGVTKGKNTFIADTAKVLGKIISTLKEKGLNVTTVSETLGLSTLENE